MRGFVQGVVWGIVAAAGGLVVVSQVAGPVVPLTDNAVVPVQRPVAPPPQPAPVAPPVAQPAPAPVEPSPPVSPAAPSPPAVAEAPPAPPVSAPPAEALASAGPVDPVVPPVMRLPPPPASAPAALGVPSAESAPDVVDPPPPQDEAVGRPVPPPSQTPPDPTPQPVADPMPAPVAEPPVSAMPPPGLGTTASGVVTGRLPRIGAEPTPDPENAESAPRKADLSPRERYARPFDNPGQKPLFAIVLIDDGAADVNRAALAALDLPLSIVIDPLATGAADRAAQWRAGGQEILMAASGIPAGASPSDLEQSLQVLSAALPEAVALIDSAGTGFQNDRPLAGQMVPILVDQGRGLVTFDLGLNAADQEARRNGLPSTTIFRSIDAEAEGAQVVGRYLDRAAFKAAQDGRVVVIGTLRPDTVAGIMQWAVESRASTVALAPITALLQP